jgi:Uma2 family endonuclease
MVIRERLYTAEDLWELSHLPENNGKRFELSEGVLITMSPAGWEHGDTAGNIFGRIWLFVRQHQLGSVTAAETGYILFKNPDPDGKDTVRAPDVGFISAARVPADGLPQQYVPFAPDLAVEVVSPNDDADEIQQKVIEYLKYGTRLVWVFYPKSKTVAVHTPDGSRIIGLDGTLDGGAVLPGFTLAVRDVFGA